MQTTLRLVLALLLAAVLSLACESRDIDPTEPGGGDDGTQEPEHGGDSDAAAGDNDASPDIDAAPSCDGGAGGMDGGIDGGPRDGGPC